MTLAPGDVLQGRYRVGAPLARGGMASVFEAREEPENTELVVKLLRLDAPELLESFRGEFALLSRISDPHLLRVVDFGSERLRGELCSYYVADRVEGTTLGESARRGGADLLRPVIGAVAGLAALHDAGIRHGDFTPENVLVAADGSGILIDLGCARPFGVTEQLAGTPGFLAPELLEGRAGDARSDLFAVGCTLRQLFQFAARVPPPAVGKLIERLVRSEPAARPGDCREVLEALGHKGRRSKRSFVPARILGREAELASFEQWLRKLSAGEVGPRVLALAGAAGMGLSRLMREFVALGQLHVSVFRARAAQPPSKLLATALGIAEPIRSQRGVLAALGMLADRASPLLLVVEDLERLESEERELVAALARSLGTRGNLGLVLSGRAPATGDGVLTLTCGALTEAAIETWLSLHLNDKRVREIAAQSAGSPKKIEQLLREQLGEAQPNRPASAPARRTALDALTPAARETLALLVTQGSESSLASLGLSWSQVSELAEQRLLERDGDELCLAEGVERACSDGGLSREELLSAQLRAAEWFSLGDERGQTGLAPARVARHLVLGGQLERAEALVERHLARLAFGPRKVAELLGPLVQASRKPALLLELSRLLLAHGRPRDAIRAASRAARYDRRRELRHAAAIVVSDALARLGRPARAELLLGGLLTDADAAREGEAADVLQRLARARLSRGDYAGARATAERAIELGASGVTLGLCRETLGVACAYLGELARAERELDSALAGLGDAAQPRERSRIQSHRAMVAFRSGRIDSALADYSAALALAEEHDLDDLIAVGLLNLGTAEQQAGLWGGALRHYDRGVTFARALGRTSTELTLEYNLANLYAEIGAFERAEETLSRLAAKASAAQLSHFGPAIALIRAEVRLAQGDADAAEAELHSAERLLESRSQPRELFEVRLRLVDVELVRGRAEQAERRLSALTEREQPIPADLELSLEQARGRVGAALGRASALERLEGARNRAHCEGLRSLEATLETELSGAAQRLGRPEDARASTERARRLWDRVGSDLPSGLSAVFWRHSRRSHLVEQSRPVAVRIEGGAGQEAEAYRRLLSLNRRLNSSLSLDRVLEYAVQAALDLTEAERGFLVLVAEPAAAEASAPRVVVACSSDPTLPEGEGPSQSIVRRTLEREEAILTTDAQGDPRFAGQGSVHALRLKSVLSVPVSSPSGPLGVLYVDCRVQRGRFSESERQLLLAFADQLAIAIENARLHQRLEQRTAELARQKQAVEQLSRGQAREIERLKREVQTQRESLELRYDYSQIVGRGPAMRAVLERLDKVIASDASVLVLGESGTGKELVARAIHWNGPRRGGPFMGINCAALPEALLESELFGHVRGAFSGADRDKPGLMQAAAGGTLFLDELGELSLSTQAKLLRALQEREVRPLGAEKAVKLDIRLVCATHRDLQAAMSEGRFREDLYYRIAVVTVALPPLRDRPEDLPALCERILERLAREAGKKPPQLAQDALRLLSAHPFPGNVRELENVLTRAFVLSPGSKIRAEDLDLGGRRAPAQRARSRRDFESDERERILAALRGARWNVSVVARSLGIPRNTLYRKLARYGLTRVSQAASK